jgi:hypothetical protein
VGGGGGDERRGRDEDGYRSRGSRRMIKVLIGQGTHLQIMSHTVCRPPARPTGQKKSSSAK